VKEINEGEETQEFLKIWYKENQLQKNNLLVISQINSDWNNWYKDFVNIN
jgi:hypothetical protein